MCSDTYLITVVNPIGEVSRKVIVAGDKLSDPQIKLIYDRKVANRVGECLILEGYDFFSDKTVADYYSIIEILSRRLRLAIYGAGHVGRALAILGKLMGYSVVVLDDREEFLTSIRECGAEGVKVDFSQLDIKLSSDEAAVIVTRGHQYDELCLKYILQFPVKYVGMIGSKRRVSGICKRLEREFSEELLKKVHAPVGLRIGAVSPMEIAVSIIAEIISVVNR